MNVEKTLYLCRHGKTEANENGIVQGWHNPLSGCGIQQAARLGYRLARIAESSGMPFQHIYCSPMIRAKQTAYLANKPLSCLVTENADLIECMNPTHFQGKSINEPDFIKYMTWFVDLFAQSKQIYDEETFGMARERAFRAEQFLRDAPEMCAVVVTHGVFLRYLLCVMRYGASFSPEMFLQSGEEFENTVIVKVEYGAFRNPLRVGKKGWRVWVGDASHVVP